MIGLNASVFVESAISNNALILFTKSSLPNLTGVAVLLTVCVVLAFAIDKLVNPILSISKPLTYALPMILYKRIDLLYHPV